MFACRLRLSARKSTQLVKCHFSNLQKTLSYHGLIHVLRLTAFSCALTPHNNTTIAVTSESVITHYMWSGTVLSAYNV